MRSFDDIVEELRNMISEAETVDGDSKGVSDEKGKTEAEESESDGEPEEAETDAPTPFDADGFKADILSEVRKMVGGLMLSNGGDGDSSDPEPTKPQTIEELDLL